MQKRYFRASLIASGLVALSACATAPVQQEAEEAASASLPTAPTDWAMIQETVGDVELGWVESFDDQTLSALVQEALQNNRNLQGGGCKRR